MTARRAVTIGNSGGQQLDWATPRATTASSPPRRGAPWGRRTVDVVISVNRAGLIEGEYAATVSVLGAGGAPITVRWWVERSPVVQLGVEPAGLADAATCPPDHASDRGRARRRHRRVLGLVGGDDVDGPGGDGEHGAGDGGAWDVGGAARSVERSGTWTVTVTATDDRGNTGEGSTTPVVTACSVTTTTRPPAPDAGGAPGSAPVTPR